MTRFLDDARAAGLLLPVFAMRHARDFGIGDTIAVRQAIDFCAEHDFAVLQFLPIHETVGDHSPYNPISSRALSPALLALTPDEVPGLTREMIAAAAPEAWLAQLRTGIVKHFSVQPLKLHLLLEAHHAFRTPHGNAGGDEHDALTREFHAFQQREASWLPGYTLFRLLVREYEGNPAWTEWRPEHQSLAGAEAWLARHPHRERLSEAREGYAFVQWIAHRQWRSVREYAEGRGVRLMGEMSFGVSRASVDVWQHRELFDLDWNLGTQPLSFFDTAKDAERWGQNWGLPAYRWENHRAGGFAWLRERIASEAQYFQMCRLDHLRGYFRTYQFPWQGGPQHAEFSQLTLEEVHHRTGGRMPRFVPGPDDDPTAVKLNDLQAREIIGVIRAAAGGMDLVAEIMGEPAYMTRALDDLAMPSLTFPQLALRPDGSPLPPAEFRRLSLATYANHDTAPLAMLYPQLRDSARAEPTGMYAKQFLLLLRFAQWKGRPPETMTEELLHAWHRALFETPCQLAVLMSSDLLGIPQRFNLPGSFGRETWCERLEFPLSEYAAHPTFAPRIAAAKKLIAESGRSRG